MPKSKNEELLLNGKLNNTSKENKGLYGHISPIKDFRMNPTPYYWNPPISYPPYPYSYPYGYTYQAASPQYAPVPQPPATPVSKNLANKRTESLPAAPIGRVLPESNPANTSLPLTQPAPAVAYNPIQVPYQYIQPSAPQPQYYYPQASSSFYYQPPHPTYYDARRRSPPPFYLDRHHLPPYV